MKFTYNPRIIKHLGTELITSDEIAITELIKNSYDAKAKAVRLQFLSSLEKLDRKNLLTSISSEVEAYLKENALGQIILLEDNGIGMSKETLRDGFFEIGTSLKADEKKGQDINDTIILGDKGIGRLSAQRLSSILVVETTSINDAKINVVKIDWEKFLSDSSNEAEEKYFDKNGKESYTRLWFLETETSSLVFNNFFSLHTVVQKDIFGNVQETKTSEYIVKPELESSLSFLYSPFEVNKAVIDVKIIFDQSPVNVNFNYDTLKIAESLHSFDSRIIKKTNDELDLLITMKMEIHPWFIERIHQSEIGKVLYQDWKLPHREYKKLYEKYIEKYRTSLKEEFLLSDILKRWKIPSNYLKYIIDISPIEGKVYSFKRDSFLMKMAVDSAIDNGIIDAKTTINSQIKPFLDANNGIKLYRNNFRVGTIGNKDNDWLKLQQKRTSGQQFYRFELGNAIGYIKINDFYQKHIYETSSREHLTDNLYVKALQAILEYIFDAFSPGFTKRAVEITKDILDIEKLIPKNDTQELKQEVKKSNDILNAANANIQAIKKAFAVIDENIDLDTDNKKEAIKNVLNGLKEISQSFEQNITDAKRSFQSANKLIRIAESEQKRIEIEAYNNFKLMANGLVTEVITHELHSLVSYDNSREQNDEHFNALRNYLFEQKQFELNKQHLEPINKKFNALFSKMSDLNRFYSFLEKTFLYKGNSHDFEKVAVAEYLAELNNRFDFRLKKNKINLNFETVNQMWVVPKGSLTHIFYNLIDNSIYWIQERQRRARYDSSYLINALDSITIRGIDEHTIHFFDSGTGVLSRYEHTLFNSLESGKENGRGMGLYIVRNFLKSFGGDIELLPERNVFNNRYIFEIKVKQSNIEESI